MSSAMVTASCLVSRTHLQVKSESPTIIGVRIPLLFRCSSFPVPRLLTHTKRVEIGGKSLQHSGHVSHVSHVSGGAGEPAGPGEPREPRERGGQASRPAPGEPREPRERGGQMSGGVSLGPGEPAVESFT